MERNLGDHRSKKGCFISYMQAMATERMPSHKQEERIQTQVEVADTRGGELPHKVADSYSLGIVLSLIKGDDS